ncbi:unnamed protein product [Musa acuminata subsp. malaccensis]|uniref:RING-type E3 ubiquitin transferase n=1 Tax=Musa acuminata subsp. malaccensis TaxID=214687 RepID=A0A804I8H4_MUSAM|nr:unnamed protein product [Musa acuminata subsp. malaccensis]
MDWVLHESIKGGDFSSPIPLPLPVPPPPPPVINSERRINLSILIIFLILAIIFFITGLNHLLLQRLFHLHDAGVDQSFIDTLPVFLYRSIICLEDPFDCAVCLCQCEADDKLRLLPKCSHAFHVQCIDTWLMSHCTCPLCTRSLLPDLSPTDSFGPVVLVLEPGSESSRETASEREDSMPNIDLVSEASETKVVPVKLGKFRSVYVGEGSSTANGNLDQRRCFSMGSYEYVMDDRALLQVPIKPPKMKPEHRATEFRGDVGNVGISSHLHMKESFSVSKIWLQSKKEKSMAGDSSRRALSFRTGDELYLINVDLDVEVGRCNDGVGSWSDGAFSFARRTLLRLAARQNL